MVIKFLQTAKSIQNKNYQMKSKKRQLLLGILRVFISVVIVGIAMWLTGDFQKQKWILFLSMAVLPWYYVYKIYIKTE